MKTKHTPGEWIFNKYTPCDFGVHSIEGRGNDIALVRGTDEEAEANAKLIAAAPVMLEALQKAIEVIERLSDEYSTIANHHASYTVGEARIIEGAIRKATE
jgi:hypothetical protein